MAEYRLEFEANSGAAERSISNLRKSIGEITKEFEKSEIGAEDFIKAAGEISRLKKEYNDARNAVANIDKAYRDLNKAIEANFAVHTKATNEASKYHENLLRLAEDSFRAEDKLRDKNFQAEQDDWDRRLAIAVAAKNKIAAQQKAIMEFRAGMGTRGAIPAIASPVRGSAQQFGSPEYFDALNRDLKQAIDEGRQLDVEIKKAAESRNRAIVEFRSGMAGRGAISGVASPIRGGADIMGSPDFLQPLSLGRLENRLTKLKEEARRISPVGEKWEAINKEVIQLERGIERIQKRQRLGPTAGQRASAAGGAFLYGGGMGGGVGSALGGVAGGLAGGLPGAFAGAAIGQVADNLGTALAGITSQASKVQQLQRGLALASIDAKDFAQAQAAVADVSARLFIPLEQVTKSFSQLRVNTKQYGLSVEETKQILEGTILAVSAFGGSADDVDGAMRAVVQILSKGSVQAEELRGQLGERFPGAVIKFAQANKLSFDELQDRLKEGSIGIKEFVTFAKKNYEDYAAFSEKLATAPEFAGRRLQIALEQISLEIGGLFGPMGAGIQDLLTSTINNIAQFIKENRGYLRQMISDFSSIVGPIAKVFVELMKVIANFSVQVGKIFQGLFANIRQALGMASIGEAKARLDRAKAATAGKTRPTRNARGGGTTTSAEFIELEAAQRAFSGLGGQAAFNKANAPAQPSDLVFGGPGAGMDMTAKAADEEKKKKTESLESFERLRDQLANAYNQAEIERIKARYELEKQLQDNLRDVQELGANRLERLNLQFIRNLQNAERKRVDAMMDAQLDLMQVQGKVAGGAGIGVTGGNNFSTAQLQKASSEAAKFTGIANMCSESVKAFYKSLGISLPGVTAWADTVRKAGKTMTDWSKLQAGDIVATGRPGDTPHVGVYTGGNNVFHQSRKRGLKAGNYPDLDYFKSGYFVRPSAMDAGAPRKVGSNENRDMLAAANAEIKRGNILLVEKNGLLLKDSEIMKIVASYVDEAFGVPNLELDNKLLAERNRLMAEGVDENTINYRLKLIEMESRHTHLTKLFDEELKKANLTEEQRAVILGVLAQGLNQATAAEKAKNDETLRGLFIQEQTALGRRMTMAQALTPDQELRAQIGERFSGAEAEQLFQQTKAVQAMEKQKEQFQGIASSIGDSFGQAFKGIITGSMTAQEALAGMFQSIADHFADMVAKMIAEWIKMMVLKGIEAIINPMAGLGNLAGGIGGGLSSGFSAGAASAIPTDAAGWGASFGTSLQFANGGIAAGGFTAFANGGMVTGPTMGLVGEGRYNEAIVPLPDGKSIPVELAGGGSSSPTVIVNVDAKGSQVEGNEQNANQLGRVISAAVQTELIKQQRPGGLLAR